MYFIESITNVNECKTLVRVTDEVSMQLESNIQDFLSDFSVNYLTKVRTQEITENLRKQKRQLNHAYIFFAYLNKAAGHLEKQQYESSIRLINIASEKYLKTFPISSKVYKRGEQVLISLKKKITDAIEEKLTNWLVSIVTEQISIGQALYKKLQLEEIRVKNTGNSNDSNVRTTKNIVDNLLLIRNTANLNYMMNKNSMLKKSVLNDNDSCEEFDILNMVSNVNLNLLEQAYSTYKKVDIDTKFIEHFLSFRQSQLLTILRVDSKDRGSMRGTMKNSTSGFRLSTQNKSLGRRKSSKIDFGVSKATTVSLNCDLYFSEILGYLIIQVAVFELLPVFYTKRKFDDIMLYFIKELANNLSYEFSNLTNIEDFIAVERSVFIFIKAIDRVGISARIGIDLKSSLIEIMKDKSHDLNFILIKKYNNIFVNLLFEEKGMNIEVKNKDEFVRYCTQYSISNFDNDHGISNTAMSSNLNQARDINTNNIIYPYSLPYTQFVVDVNENFKKYVDELYEFIKPLHTEYESAMESLVDNFLKKFNEVFHTFSNFQETELNIILAAYICSNIKYIAKSKSFYSEYVMKKCYNVKNITAFSGAESQGQGESKRKGFNFKIEQTLKATW